MKRAAILVIALILCLVTATQAGPNDPIVGEEFSTLRAYLSNPDLDSLDVFFPDSCGCTLFSPLDIINKGQRLRRPSFDMMRVVCADLAAFRTVVARLKKSSHGPLDTVVVFQDLPVGSDRPLRGAEAWSGDLGTPMMAIHTVNGARAMIWQHRIEDYAEVLNEYATAVSDYLYSLDTGWLDAPAPRAVSYGLPDSVDFYADPPPYVIEGYDNYKNFLYAHDTIRVDFADGLTEFAPSDSLWEAMKEAAPRAAFPNKEWPMLQHEYRKFFDRGGDVRVMQTLTHEGFDTLHTGEYFFAVSVAGKVRFGRELQREEVAEIEEQTGKKVPRANHAFLFPGEPVLTAGAFFIEEDEESVPHIVRINAQSGHYFYSNVSPTIRQDIAELSDYYLSTLGHFFVVLDSHDIPHDNVVISKM